MKTMLIALMSLSTLSAFAHEGGGSTAGVPNPSGLLCKSLGGTGVPLKDKDGNEYSACAFGRAQIDSWTLYGNASRRPQEAVETFLKHPEVVLSSGRSDGPIGMPNPAAVYCTKVGGQLFMLEDADGQGDFCKFSDGSMIEEWTLFRGPADTANAKLVAALAKRLKI